LEYRKVIPFRHKNKPLLQKAKHFDTLHMTFNSIVKIFGKINISYIIMINNIEEVVNLVRDYQNP